MLIVAVFKTQNNDVFKMRGGFSLHIEQKWLLTLSSKINQTNFWAKILSRREKVRKKKIPRVTKDCFDIAWVWWLFWPQLRDILSGLWDTKTGKATLEFWSCSVIALGQLNICPHIHVSSCPDFFKSSIRSALCIAGGNSVEGKTNLV